MASQKSLDALEKIRTSLNDIQDNHIGRLLSHLEASQHPRVQAQAKAALAITMGTLRLMGARLRGLDNVDPLLRTELNQMRKLLRGVQKKHQDGNKSESAAKRHLDNSNPDSHSKVEAQEEEGKKRHKNAKPPKDEGREDR